ncbi:hypothetical protein N7492_009393 [Penicillium capsulatum]|uniref:ChrR-like cupin domain-containing protein n=1 Tax=Penicillium capsulatum TaxID=69766 RepID=A0A9W9HUJ5_9EURO|nr:hypothetical protein N7492_009393 [Penicillium capsulatum]KAJ6106786.1 hypothetical protein N7512_010303 [Penicillium capsulatum]
MASESTTHPASSPSTSKLSAADKAEIELANSHGSPDIYVNGEKDTCWYPWANCLELKPLRFDTRTGTFVLMMRSLEDTWLGRHRHRGAVSAVTLKGEWNYAEPGDYVVENPGAIHTLHMGKGTEVIFTVSGSLSSSTTTIP